MLTKEDMQQLVNFALNHKKDLGDVEVLSELAKKLKATVPDWENTAIEETQQRIQEIIQDIFLRHQFFHSEYPDITKIILEEVNFQLNSGRVHLHTLVPIRGLSVYLDFSHTIQINEKIALRRVQRWEWQEFDRLIRYSGSNLPEFALELVKEISSDMIDNEFQDALDELIVQIRIILGLLQFQFGQGMSFPWIIRYVPRCQFVQGHGKMMARLFPMSPGDNIGGGTHSISDLQNISQLLSNRSLLDTETRNRIDIAINRFHEGANRRNIEDSQIDYWIALEALFGKGGHVQTRKMAFQISCFLFGYQENENITRAFLWLEVSYQLRCDIVHGDHHSKEEANFLKLYKIVEQTKEVVKWTIERLILLQMPYHKVLKQIDKRSGKVNLPSKDEVNRIKSDETKLISILNEMDEVMELYREKTEHNVIW